MVNRYRSALMAGASLWGLTASGAVMAFVQESYPDAQKKGVPGLIANMELANVISRTNSGATAIPFSCPVLRSGDHTVVVADEPAFTAVGAAGVPAPAAATITAAPAAVAPVKPGVYTVRCIIGGAGTTSKWEVKDPDGIQVGVATGNTEFVGGGLTFTVTDAGTDPVEGETFIITVTASVDVGSFLGLAVRDVTLDPSHGDTYKQLDTVNVMTKGVMWVVAGATVAAGDPVYWDDEDGRFTNLAVDLPIAPDNGGVPTARFDSSGGDGDLVLVRLY